MPFYKTGQCSAKLDQKGVATAQTKLCYHWITVSDTVACNKPTSVLLALEKAPKRYQAPTHDNPKQSVPVNWVK